jgi:tetratricopeptide (TPR) repeat protein
MWLAGRPEEAVKLKKKKMRLDPTYTAKDFHFLGVYLHCAGRYEEAITAYEKVLKLHKKTGEWNTSWTHLGLTATHLELGQIENAGKHYKEALALDPGSNFIAWAKIMVRYKDKNLERLKSLFEPLRQMYADTDIKNKQYIHVGPPAFKFNYPEGSKNLRLTGQNEILRMRAPQWYTFNARVTDIPEGMKLENFGPKAYLPTLSELGTNFNVISNESITLKDGTKAYKTSIKWLWKDGKTWITTLLVSAYKEDKCVQLMAHPTGDPKEVAWIVESLTFQ